MHYFVKPVIHYDSVILLTDNKSNILDLHLRENYLVYVHQERLKMFTAETIFKFRDISLILFLILKLALRIHLTSLCYIPETNTTL